MTELCGKGELFDKIVDEKRLPEDKARGIFSEILSAVEHAHANNIVHRKLNHFSKFTNITSVYCFERIFEKFVLTFN